ncbi:MAG: DUF58 domain-containing protein [Deltaproteobacteria bacterium]|nr:DUF58 domain-containing protein [Deltaproteobacteria bacterium]
MRPSLTATGATLLAVGGFFVFCGLLAQSWPLFALGTLQVSSLLVLHLLLLPQVGALRRRELELAWWVAAPEHPGGILVAGRPVDLHVLLRNRSPVAFTPAGLRVIASSTLEAPVDGQGCSVVPSRSEVTFRLEVVPRAAGHWFLHGVLLRTTDRLGLFSLELYFPHPLELKVFPPAGASKLPLHFRPRTGATHERAGLRVIRQRGMSSDLRELREHSPGDPFKNIAWKATARTGRLMVREFESEIMTTHWLLLDISPTMREPAAPGQSKLDHALGLAAGLARAALDRGDRVGLLTFDTRVCGHVPPRDGRPQVFRLLDRLLEAQNVVDEDLTDLTDQELYGAVADFLRLQDGLDTRLVRPPPRGSPVWADLVEGPHGEWIDRDATHRAVRESLARRRDGGTPSWWTRIVAASPETAELRLFCRLRGIEVPYRRPSPLARKHQGLAAALGEAAFSRASQMLLVLTDLEDVGEPREVLDVLALAQRRRHHVVVLAPYGPAFAQRSAGVHEARMAVVLGLRHRRQREEIRGSIERLGIPVLSLSPEDTAERVLARLARGTPRRAGSLRL